MGTLQFRGCKPRVSSWSRCIPFDRFKTNEVDANLFVSELMLHKIVATSQCWLGRSPKHLRERQWDIRDSTFT